VAVEGTIANDVPGVPEQQYVTVLGKGPALRVMDRSIVASRRLLLHVRMLAEERAIPYQLQVSPYSGTDSGSFLIKGAETTAISVPVRYIHTPTSLALRSDLEAAVRLVRALLEEPWPKE